MSARRPNRFACVTGIAIASLASMTSACAPDAAPPQRTASPPAAAAVASAAPAGAFVTLVKYDPTRDPAADLQLAVAEATKTQKRILLEVGGEWCIWCHIMDGYFEEHADLRDLRDRQFVTLKVNFSDENQNKAFLSSYPKIPGYPHIFVLDSNGTFLHSQGTGDLESGKSYDLEKFSSFLKSWAPTS